MWCNQFSTALQEQLKRRLVVRISPRLNGRRRLPALDRLLERCLRGAQRVVPQVEPPQHEVGLDGGGEGLDSELVPLEIERRERRVRRERPGQRGAALRAQRVVGQVEARERRVRAQRLGDRLAARRLQAVLAQVELGQSPLGEDTRERREVAASSHLPMRG